jgi:hypothetical protein
MKLNSTEITPALAAKSLRPSERETLLRGRCGVRRSEPEWTAERICGAAVKPLAAVGRDVAV